MCDIALNNAHVYCSVHSASYIVIIIIIIVVILVVIYFTLQTKLAKHVKEALNVECTGKLETGSGNLRRN